MSTLTNLEQVAQHIKAIQMENMLATVTSFVPEITFSLTTEELQIFKESMSVMVCTPVIATDDGADVIAVMLCSLSKASRREELHYCNVLCDLLDGTDCGAKYAVIRDGVGGAELWEVKRILRYILSYLCYSKDSGGGDRAVNELVKPFLELLNKM